jgi:hypothetical protein
MARKTKIPASLEYLQNKPKYINWKVIAGPKLHFLQMYDVIFDDIDLKIRKLK